MCDHFAPLQQINLDQINNCVNSFSSRIDATFNLARQGIPLGPKNKRNSSLGWLSIFGALLQRCEELEPGIMNKMKGHKFIEFGPGLGFAGQLFSQLFEVNGINYDLPVVTKVRGLCLEEYKNHNADFFIEPEEIERVEELERRVLSLDKYSFISTWAFTESPLSVREKFEGIIANSNICVIVSNKEFSDIDNFNYLQEMAGRLKNHRHIKCDLGFLKSAPSFLKRHELHLYVSEEN